MISLTDCFQVNSSGAWPTFREGRSFYRSIVIKQAGDCWLQEARHMTTLALIQECEQASILPPNWWRRSLDVGAALSASNLTPLRHVLATGTRQHLHVWTILATNHSLVPRLPRSMPSAGFSASQSGSIQLACYACQADWMLSCH